MFNKDEAAFNRATNQRNHITVVGDKGGLTMKRPSRALASTSLNSIQKPNRNLKEEEDTYNEMTMDLGFPR